MSDLADGLPPAPDRAPASEQKADEQTSQKADEAVSCPHCGRKLLTTRSVLCNWCGARIDNEEYLAKAAKERAALDAAERERVERELAETARMGVLGRLKKVAKSGKRPTLGEPPLGV